ncbi:TetR/AcrR family transcriptional regulator [Rhizobium leguminosarum]|uniref:TetR/AcrR family transcriptional regulator n=1 Tax=Rhizobium leguminosarum TaxID=384 RepID=UPI001030FA76|nr:TetR/AcrR family transcriptional regulator C-terminal domain-containing protein [Rhizobium leguminosarum]TAU90824.1 TetR family transcriptional regulator [Rhizobium leguminosarum]TAV55483.1 TetR family transcriptional regulator [Rhizobium leguminosarum]
MARDTLTRDQIIKATVELLDSEGLEGLSMRVLGKRLDAAATAFYWHVGSKDNLLALAADAAWKEIALPDLSTVGWRTAAATMATGLHSMLLRHPWLVQAFGSYMVYGPGKARHDDHSLAIYEKAGLAGAKADQAAASVFIFVLGNALCHAASASLARRLSQNSGNAQETMRAARAKAREIATGFPRLRARLETAAAGYAAAPDNSFEFGLKALLDGIEAQLEMPSMPSGVSEALVAE